MTELERNELAAYLAWTEEDEAEMAATVKRVSAIERINAIFEAQRVAREAGS